jgi:hypothetical protein
MSIRLPCGTAYGKTSIPVTVSTAPWGPSQYDAGCGALLVCLRMTFRSHLVTSTMTTAFGFEIPLRSCYRTARKTGARQPSQSPSWQVQLFRVEGCRLTTNRSDTAKRGGAPSSQDSLNRRTIPRLQHEMGQCRRSSCACISVSFMPKGAWFCGGALAPTMTPFPVPSREMNPFSDQKLRLSLRMFRGLVWVRLS